MNEMIDPASIPSRPGDASQPDDCGCCEGMQAQTPVEIYNRSGLPSVAYRVGTHTRFLESMKVGLSDAELPALRGLTTRKPDSFSIALLDCWATVADVLTFYQERIVNESYLRTATEEKSVRELGRLIGYKPSPGVAASIWLAFTLDDAPGSPLRATIEAGTKVQSVPGKDETPQVFETKEGIEARAEWNAIKPLMLYRAKVSAGIDSASLEGTTNPPKRGDSLLIVEGSGTCRLRTVLNVSVDPVRGHTRVDFARSPSLPGFDRPVGRSKGVVASYPPKSDLETSAKRVLEENWDEDGLSALAKAQGWQMEVLASKLTMLARNPQLGKGTGIFAFRQKAAIFGHNRPKKVGLFRRSQDKEIRFYQWLSEPSLRSEATTVGELSLDAVYPQILKESLIVLRAPAELKPAKSDPDQELRDYRVYQVKSNVEATLNRFPLVNKVSRLLLQVAGGPAADSPKQIKESFDEFSANLIEEDFGKFPVGATTVLAQSELLREAAKPIPGGIKGDWVILDRIYLELKAGREVILTGERSDFKGTTASELLVVKEATIEAGFTVLTFEEELQHEYVRDTVSINANVALATHGESVPEVLGSGNPGRPHQQFVLQQGPLTYIAANTPEGAESSLKVFVNDIQWHETKTFLEHGPHDRVFITRIDDKGQTIIEFGDGIHGRLLPTGVENVRAKYRKGTGREGLVKAAQLSQLMTRPLGVKAVINPLPASGAADKQLLNEIRSNAPLDMLAFGRAVSLKDYEDFTRAFPGIAKAHVKVTGGRRDGQSADKVEAEPGGRHKRHVFITIAGKEGTEISEGSNTYLQLTKALKDCGNPRVTVLIRSYESIKFTIGSKITVNPDHEPAVVLEAVKEVLAERFSFNARSFGQKVTKSEVIAAIQATPGVNSVSIQKLERSDRPSPPGPEEEIEPNLHPGEEEPVELLSLDESSLAGVEVWP